MNLTFGNSKLSAFSPLTLALSPLRGEGVGSWSQFTCISNGSFP